MKNNYDAFYYYRYEISKYVLLACGFFVPIIHILTLEKNEKADFKFIVIPVLISLISVFLLSFCRKMILGKLMCYDLDFKMIYELDKRKNTSHNRYYNSKLLMRAYLYSGFFDRVLELSDVVLLSPKDEDRFFAIHMRILSLFFKGEYKDISLLIESQKKMLNNMKSVELDEYVQIYSCIESFVYGDYLNTIYIADNIFSQRGIEKLNHRKILIFYILKLASAHLNDVERMALYDKKIIECDPNRYTFFTLNIRDGYDVG